MALTPEQRKQRARMAGLANHAKNGPMATAAARRGLEARWEREVDPDGVLTPQELERRVAQKRKAHMARMTFLASQARTRRAGTTGASPQGGTSVATPGPAHHEEEPPSSDLDGSSTTAA